MEISFTPDSDGYMSQECPECEKRFKVKFTQDEDGQPIRFCLYCGHSGEDCWWTQEQINYITANLAHEGLIPELQKMAQRLENSSHGGFIQLKANIKTDPIPPQPIEPDGPWPIKEFDCCGEAIKHDGLQITIHCPMCGTSTSA